MDDSTQQIVFFIIGQGIVIVIALFTGVAWMTAAFRVLSERSAVQEQWKIDHELQDDGFHERTCAELTKMWIQIEKISERVLELERK